MERLIFIGIGVLLGYILFGRNKQEKQETDVVMGQLTELFTRYRTLKRSMMKEGIVSNMEAQLREIFKNVDNIYHIYSTYYGMAGVLKDYKDLALAWLEAGSPPIAVKADEPEERVGQVKSVADSPLMMFFDKLEDLEKTFLANK